MLADKIKEAILRIDELCSSGRTFRIITHFDTNGITSAAIFSRAMSRWGKKFSLEIVKELDEAFISCLSGNEVLIFLDLVSGSLEYYNEMKNEVVVFGHHEFKEEVPKNVLIVSSQNCNEKLSAAAVCYLFARELSLDNRDLAKLSVIGMVGNLYENKIGKTFSEIVKDSEAIVKKGLLIHPSTRPLNRVLEYSSNPYIPGVTGNREGVHELLREARVGEGDGKFKALYELDDEEMTRLNTSIMLRGRETSVENLAGNLFLVKFYNKLEDARELSALINVCSRMGSPETALGFCLGNKIFKEEAERIYLNYKQALFSALKYVGQTDKVEGKNYIIINAKNKVKDTIIGTVVSIISNSPLFPNGRVIVALAYSGDKIKVCARLSGRDGRNVRELLYKVVSPLGCEVGGHRNVAECFISRDKEEELIGELKRVLDVEVVRV